VGMAAAAVPNVLAGTEHSLRNSHDARLVAAALDRLHANGVREVPQELHDSLVRMLSGLQRGPATAEACNPPSPPQAAHAHQSTALDAPGDSHAASEVQVLTTPQAALDECSSDNNQPSGTLPRVVLLCDDPAAVQTFALELTQRGIDVDVWNVTTVVLCPTDAPTGGSAVSYVPCLTRPQGTLTKTCSFQESHRNQLRLRPCPAVPALRAVAQWLCAHGSAPMELCAAVECSASSASRAAWMHTSGVPVPPCTLLHDAAAALHAEQLLRVRQQSGDEVPPSGGAGHGHTSALALKADSSSHSHGVLRFPSAASMAQALAGHGVALGGGWSVLSTAPAGHADQHSARAADTALRQSIAENGAPLSRGPAVDVTTSSRAQKVAAGLAAARAQGTLPQPITWDAGAPWLLQQWCGPFVGSAGSLETTYTLHFSGEALYCCVCSTDLVSRVEVCSCDGGAMRRAAQASTFAVLPGDMQEALPPRVFAVVQRCMQGMKRLHARWGVPYVRMQLHDGGVFSASLSPHGTRGPLHTASGRILLNPLKHAAGAFAEILLQRKAQGV